MIDPIAVIAAIVLPVAILVAVAFIAAIAFAIHNYWFCIGVMVFGGVFVGLELQQMLKGLQDE